MSGVGPVGLGLLDVGTLVCICVCIFFLLTIKYEWFDYSRWGFVLWRMGVGFRVLLKLICK